MYNRIWENFCGFCKTYLIVADSNLPVTITTLSLYLAHLHNKGLASSTISSYNSAVGFFHKLHNLADPSNSFFILKLLQGIKKTNPSFDNRLPITLPILKKLVDILPVSCSSYYYSVLYKAMFLLAFYGFLRIGEITRNDQNEGKNHCLQLQDVKAVSDGFIISFKSYKHSTPGLITQIHIGKQEINYCPVFHLAQYLYLRSKSPGPLFISPEGSPVNRVQFTQILNQSLSLAGLPSSCYKSHSFRIGASSFAMELGKSDAQIRALGRWKSNAFLKYIRPQISSL